MTDDRRSDGIIRSWIEAGPDSASTEFIEETLRPIPHMRQRGSWRIAVDRLARPIATMTAATAAIAVVVATVALLGGMANMGAPAGQTTPPSSPPNPRPTFELRVGDGPTPSVYRSDPTASVATCGVRSGQSYALYAGGEPFVSIDLIVGAGANQPGGEDRVAAEITTDRSYVRFDPAILRGGDAVGRSQATVTVTTDGDATTFLISAITPERITGQDGAPIRIEMTLTCAP